MTPRASVADPFHHHTWPATVHGLKHGTTAAAAARRWTAASSDLVAVLLHAADVDGSAAGGAAASALAQAVAEAARRLRVAIALLSPSPPPPPPHNVTTAGLTAGRAVAVSASLQRPSPSSWQGGGARLSSMLQQTPQRRLRRDEVEARCPQNDTDWQWLSTWASPRL